LTACVLRFGRAVNLSLRFHTQIPEDVFVETTDGLQFRRLAGLTPKDLEAIAQRIFHKTAARLPMKKVSNVEVVSQLIFHGVDGGDKKHTHFFAAILMATNTFPP